MDNIAPEIIGFHQMGDGVLGTVVWITGLPATGKTTLAQGLVEACQRAGRVTLWLDSDNLRQILSLTTNYEPQDRDGFYGVLGRLALLGAEGGAIVIVSATAARSSYRDDVRDRLADRVKEGTRESPSFVEILLRCGLPTLERRDPKGLYQRARRGEVEHLPGLGATYEEPQRAEIVVDTERHEATEVLESVTEKLKVFAVL